jgi:hypothetical protein
MKCNMCFFFAVPVTTPEEVLDVLKKASRNRAVASTNLNEHSSRSHR